MAGLVRILFLLLALLAGNAYAVTCTSVASKDWNNQNAWSCGNQPPAGAAVVIASGTTIKADANTNTVGSITVNAGGTLQVQQNQTITLTGNFTVNGTLTAQANSTVAFAGTNQAISGNVTFANLTVGANTQLTLTGNITINGTTNLTQANIASTCPANYTVTQNGAIVAQSCAGGGGGGGGGGGACSTLPAALTSGTTLGLAQTGFLLNTQGGTTNVVNSTVAPATTVSATGNLNALSVNAAPTAALTATLPALSPATFPTIAGTNGGMNNGNNATVAAGSYTTINVTGGTTSFSGGATQTYIQKLASAAGTVLQFAPGDYYIDSLTVGGNLTIGPTQGLVRLFIGTQQTGAYGSANTTGGNNANGFQNGAQINAGGNPANLQLLLYPLVTYFEFSNNVSFTGIMYQPSVQAGAPQQANWFPTNGAIGPGFDLHPGVTITGALYTPGTIKTWGSNVFNYTPQVASAISAFNTCGTQVGPDHILISHTGSALTCSPQTVTLTVCANAACTSYYTGTVTGTLSPGGTPFTISGGTGTATVQQTTVGTATLGATALNPAPTAATQVVCQDTANNNASCNMAFSNAGFVITAPNHVACTDAAVTIEAMQAGANNRCVPAYANVTRAVNLNIAYANPSSGTMSVTDITNNNSAIGAVANAHNLAFDATGKATLVIGYPDVGQVTLFANDTAPTGAAMTGSGSFVAAPAALAFGTITASPIKAGNPFDATVTATTGIGTVCPAAVPAPNYGHETPPQLVLAQNLVTGVNAGTLSASTFVPQASGVTATQDWSEAGVIKLTASLPGGSYLGYVPAVPVTATSAQQLTFIPDHFDTAIIATGAKPAWVPMNCPAALACPLVYDDSTMTLMHQGMVYSGQPFSVQVTARNKGGSTTQNYDQGAVAKQVTLAAWSQPSGGTQNPAGTTTSLTGNTVTAATFANGVATTTTPAYALQTNPLALPTDVYFRATDADNVTSGATVGGVKVANGRIRLANAHGSELLPLPMRATVQYWNGNYVTSATDNVSLAGFSNAGVTYANCQKLSVTSLWPATCPPPSLPPTAVSASVKFTNGVLDFALNAPGADKAGSVDITINMPSYLVGNPALATFGVYKNNGKFIYVRQVY